MKYVYLFVAILSVQAALAQSKLPVIKAASKNIVINDDGELKKNNWTLEPKLRPDVYTAERARTTKYVTFYTDIDSIRVKVKPGTKFNFVILLNGKDSCYTRIESAIQNESKSDNGPATHDTIPFVLTTNNAISIKTIVNNTDTLLVHFDASGYGFRLTRDAILKRTHLLSNQPDALAGKVSPNYNKLNKVSKIQMGQLVLNNPSVLSTLVTAEGMDGRMGWNLFEGKQVELDYDKNLLIIHSKLPTGLRGYTKSKMGFARSFPYIKGSFKIGGKKYMGDFLMDNGSNQALILDSAWAASSNFAKSLRLIKTLIATDPRGNKYETKLVLAPEFNLSGFEQANIPALIFGGKNPLGFEINYLGNDLFKRFNIILDFKNDYLYLKPNKLFNLKYKESPGA